MNFYRNPFNSLQSNYQNKECSLPILRWLLKALDDYPSGQYFVHFRSAVEEVVVLLIAALLLTGKLRMDKKCFW